MSKERQRYDFRALDKAIKDARIAKRMTREQLGEKLNFAQRYLISIEFLHHNVIVLIDTLKHLASLRHPPSLFL